MRGRLIQDPGVYSKVSLEVCLCLYQKSKWSLGTWSWVSLSNLNIYYDTKVIQDQEHMLPKKLDLPKLMNSLIELGLVERNPELFLKDAFYRPTKAGRDLMALGMVEAAKFFGS